jgi:hypothetical protein
MLGTAEVNKDLGYSFMPFQFSDYKTELLPSPELFTVQVSFQSSL